MKKAMVLLMLIAVLALALTACSKDKDDVYVVDETESTANQDATLDNLVEQDISTSNDLGDEDFIELGDMI